jgi:hypothetical protein
VVRKVDEADTAASRNPGRTSRIAWASWREERTDGAPAEEEPREDAGDADPTSETRERLAKDLEGLDVAFGRRAPGKGGDAR